ncbi:MAG: hypothetical protein ACRESZ_15010 [Methylococcales bacterium]
MIKIFSRLCGHGMLFALAKSSVLLAPLLAARQLSQENYGRVEWWLALSMALGPMMALGAHGLLAFGSVGSNARLHERTAAVYVIQAGLLMVALAVLLSLLGLGWPHYFFAPVMAQSGLICLQMALAVRLKGMGYGAWASLVESGLYLCLLLALLLSRIGGSFVNTYIALIVIASVASVIGLAKVVRLPALSRWGRRNYKGCIGMGLRYMLGGLLLGLFMAAPRGLLGIFDGDAAVGRFALVFRWLSVSIVAHQFIMTLFFRNLFVDRPTRERDRLLAVTVMLVALMSIGLVVLIRLGWLGQLGLPQPPETDHKLLWLMAAAMVLWSTTSCLEGNLYRLDAARAQILAAAAGLSGLVVAVTVFHFLNADAALTMFLAWLAGFSAIVLAQLRALAVRGLHLPRLMLAATLPVASCLILATLF